MQRLILCNFTSGDYFVRLSVPRAELTEDKFEKIASKWKRKMRDAFRKIGKSLSTYRLRSVESWERTGICTLLLSVRLLSL